jgi:cytochrome c553
VRRGDASLGLPACSSWHGESLTGVAPATPGLLGLPRDYLLSQFGAWRTRQRHAAEPDCMGEVARRLSETDVAAMATWLAVQPVRTAAVALAAAPRRLPLQCGSVPR